MLVYQSSDHIIEKSEPRGSKRMRGDGRSTPADANRTAIGPASPRWGSGRT